MREESQHKNRGGEQVGMTLVEVLQQPSPSYKVEILNSSITIRRLGRDYYINELMCKVKRENFMLAIDELKKMGDIKKITIGDWVYILQEDGTYKKIFKKDVDKLDK